MSSKATTTFTISGAVWDLLPRDARHSVAVITEEPYGMGRRVTAEGSREQWVVVRNSLIDLYGDRNAWGGSEYRNRRKAGEIASALTEALHQGRREAREE